MEEARRLCLPSPPLWALRGAIWVRTSGNQRSAGHTDAGRARREGWPLRTRSRGAVSGRTGVSGLSAVYPVQQWVLPGLCPRLPGQQLPLPASLPGEITDCPAAPRTDELPGVGRWAAFLMGGAGTPRLAALILCPCGPCPGMGLQFREERMQYFNLRHDTQAARGTDFLDV